MEKYHCVLSKRPAPASGINSTFPLVLGCTEKGAPHYKPRRMTVAGRKMASRNDRSYASMIHSPGGGGESFHCIHPNGAFSRDNQDLGSSRP